MTGIKLIELAVKELFDQLAVPIVFPYKEPVNEAEIPVTLIWDGRLELFSVPVVIPEASMYEAVCANVMNTEAETHDAETDVTGTKDMAFVVAATVANDELIDALDQLAVPMVLPI